MTDALTIDITAKVVMLTDRERRNKDRNLTIIRAGKRHFMRTGRALYRMHRDRLWRDDYPSFTAFVTSELGWSYKRAMQVIAAIAISTVVDIPIPNENVGREVLKLPSAQQAKVLILAHKASGGNLDGGWVRDAAEVQAEMDATGGLVDDGDGGMVEAHKAVIDKRLERTKRKRTYIREANEKKNGRENDRPVEGDVMVIATDERRGFVTIQCPELARIVGQGEKVYAIFYIKEVKPC